MDNLSYRYETPAGAFSKKVTAREVAANAAQRLRGPYNYRQRGKKGIHRFNQKDRFVEAYKNALVNAEEGNVFIAGDGKRSISCRVVWRVQPPAPDKSWPKKIQTIWTDVFAEFPTAHSLGVCDCRPIAGSTTWSAHAFCKAIDFGASSRVMVQIANWCVAHAKELGIVCVIHNGRIWEPGIGWHTYTGVDPHYTHVHVNIAYNPSATPKCAA